MTRLSMALIFTAIILVGCPSEDADPWSPVEQITDVVWADDQTKIAYVFERYEEKVEGTSPYLNVQTRNHRYSVFVANPDGSDARERLGAQPTRPLGELRYYASRDLLLIHDARENGRAAWIHYPDGRSEKYAETRERACDATVFATLPSPSGAWLALVRGDEDPGCLENSTTNATVSLLSTEDLSVVVGPLTLGFTDNAPELTWTPSGDFLLSDYDTTYRITTEEWDLSPLPGCFDPPTTTGARGVDGREIWVDANNFIIQSGEAVWGCQCEGTGAALYCR